MAEDTEFARKAQRALEEKEERRIEELKQMEEKMKARAKHGQVSLPLALSLSPSRSLSRSLSLSLLARVLFFSLSSWRSMHVHTYVCYCCVTARAGARAGSSLAALDMHKLWLSRRLYSGSVTALCMLLL